ncbi:MAG: YceI family protein [Sutterellaceae bacterium]|nr:YceI family protein [Burkholderiaceae bacterium]MDW8430218.1 YceI family protein [Sutterellaceae bacterium]
MKGLLLTAVFMLLAGVGAAGAVEYDRLIVESSRIAFGYRQMGVPMEGRFTRFQAQFVFDPQRPQQARAVIEVDLASIDTGIAEANDTAQTRAFFDTRNHPRARFVAQSIRALGGDRFEVTGELTIKGRSHVVSAPFAVKREGDRLLVSGALPIRRLQFGVGEGAWADLSALADEVEIRFQLVAAPAAAAVNRKGNTK